MERDGSVTYLLQRAKSGEAAAAEELWNRYFDRAVRLANSKLSPQVRKMADGEDIALSAFQSLFRRAKAGQFDRLADRDDLWQLLSRITRRKAINYYHSQTRLKRGGGQVRGESVFAAAGIDADEATGIAGFAAHEPTPDFIHEVAELYQQLLDQLDNDELRQVALLKVEGYSNAEIAQRLDKGVRAVERKLNIIRRTWKTYANESQET